MKRVARKRRIVWIPADRIGFHPSHRLFPCNFLKPGYAIIMWQFRKWVSFFLCFSLVILGSIMGCALGQGPLADFYSLSSGAAGFHSWLHRSGSVTAAAYTPPVYSPFAKTWGGAGASLSANRIAVDRWGNVYVAGQFKGTVHFDPAHLNPSGLVTSANSTLDAFLCKFDPNRNFLWVRTWGGSAGRESANGVDVDADGNPYVAGLYQGTVDFGSGYVYTSNAMPPLLFAPDNNIFVVRFNSAGVTQWVHTWGGTTGGEAYSVAVDRLNGAVYVQGDWSTYNEKVAVDFNQNDPDHPALRTSHGFYDAFLSKFDLNGKFLWNNTWGGHGYDDGTSVAVDLLGNVYVCGMYGSTDINFDPEGSAAGLGHGHGAPTLDWNYVNVFLTRFDSQGKFQWVRTWGGMDSDDAGGGVAVDPSGYVYAAGRFNCTNCNFNGDPLGTPVILSTTGFHDAFISKYDPGGTFQWVKTWDGVNDESATGLAFDSAGHIYATGWVSGIPVNPSNPNYGIKSAQAHIAALNSERTTLWARTWGPQGYLTFCAPPVFDSAGHIFLAGTFQSTANFNSDGGTDLRTATGTSDAYLIQFTIPPAAHSLYLPLLIR